MGIDAHGLKFLLYAKKTANFNKTVTIGRQNLHVSEQQVQDIMITHSNYKHDEYCEQLLKSYFGSSAVDSIDASDFEGASIIHDMNQPLPSDKHAMYDTVIDFGTLEHIYDIPRALKSCSQLLKSGGQILHVLPANNFCGHGFWQFFT